jgi:capsular exopolysaccharide synthesis family protein
MNTKPNPKPGTDSAPAIPWSALYHVLRRRAWLIISCTVLTLSVGIAYLWHTPKIYAARTVVQVEQSETKVINIQSVTPEDTSTDELLKTIEQNFMSNDLLLRTIKSAGLDKNPRFLKPSVPSPPTEQNYLDAATAALSVKLRHGTHLLDIVAQHRDPEIAQLLAQTVLKEYLRQGFEQKVSMSQMANGFLLDEAARLKARVEQSEHALQNYRETNDAASLEDKQNLTVETLKELNLRYTEARGARMKLEAEQAQAKQLARGTVQDLLTIPSVAAWPAVVEARRALADKQVEITTLAQRYRAEHPKYIQAKSQLSVLEQEFETAVRKATAALKVEYEAAQTTEQKFQEALANQQKQALDLNRMAIPYNSLLRDVQSDQAMYDAVLKRLKETEVAKGVDASNIRIVESARRPDLPVSPVPVLIIGLSLVGGLMLGLGLVILLHVTDSSLRTVDEAEAQLGLPVSAAVPNERKLKSLSDWSVLVRAPESHIAEAFRSLRTALTIKNDESSRVILFTSAAPAEGKSFCSANVAMAFAQMGLNTLLIDADLRRPRLAKMFACEEKTAGLTEHLENGLPLSKLIVPTHSGALHLLSAGAVAHNPAELLGSKKLERLFRDPALAAFDRIVIDSAPINAVSDTLNLVKYADSICLVVRANKTAKRAVLRAYHELAEAGANAVSVVLNRLPRRKGTDSYYYYSSGSYGSEGVYGAGKKKVGA